MFALNNKIKFPISPQKRYIYKHLSEFKLYLNKNNCSSRLILDVGGGTSHYKYIFEPSCYKYIPLDISQKPNLEIIGAAQKLPIKPSIFDIVLCVEVLEHIYETYDVLGELNRILKPGGYLVLAVPFIIGYHDAIDFYRFTEDALNRLLIESGFKIIKINKRGGIFSCLAGIIFQLPTQVFKSRKLSIFLTMFIIPLMYIFYALDYLDNKKSFTLGFDILALKVEGM